MVDDVLINKASSIERCVARAREEYDKNPTSFATDFTRQDAAILNIQRACEAALDMGQHLIDVNDWVFLRVLETCLSCCHEAVGSNRLC